MTVYGTAPGQPRTGSPGVGRVAVSPTGSSTVAVRLAAQLFALPPRWGWQAVEYRDPEPPPEVAPANRPEWVDPPRPDSGALRAARRSAVRGLVTRIVVGAILLGLASTAAGYLIDAGVPVGSATVELAVLVLVGILILRGIGKVISAGRRIHAFERPYLEYLAAERRRYDTARGQWDTAIRRYQGALAQVERDRTTGPLFRPVRPYAEPARIDVLGGDPHRVGWRSLLTMLGTSALGAGQRVAVLDLTGQDVAADLLAVAGARGIGTVRVTLPYDADRVDLLAGLAPHQVGEALAYALSGRQDSDDRRYERALTVDVVRRVLGCLDGPASLARIAAGVHVLRQATPPDGLLSADEINRLAEHVGETGRDESRHLRYLASQLTVLAAAGTPGAPPPWPGAPLSVIATGGHTGDDKDLLDRMLAQLAVRQPTRYADLLAVFGADRLGAAVTAMLADHTRKAGIRLLLAVDQPQGEMEKTAGTGGTVCVMKLYNHKDAAIAADFIGREHRFVLNGISLQVGRSFGDTGGDSFSAATNEGTGSKLGGLTPGRTQNSGTSHTHGAQRGWSSTDSVNESWSRNRVHEFTVDPQQILGLAETVFFLVDNSGPTRRVVAVDSRPEICLLDRVARTPLEG